MVSTATKNRRKAQRDAVSVKHQMDPLFSVHCSARNGHFATYAPTGVTGFPCFLFGDTVWGCDGHGQETKQ